MRWHVSLVIRTHVSRVAPDWVLWRILSYSNAASVDIWVIEGCRERTKVSLRQSHGADLLLGGAGHFLQLEQEESLDDHPEEARLNGVANLDEAGAVELDDVEAHERHEVLDELGRFWWRQTLEKLEKEENEVMNIFFLDFHLKRQFLEEKRKCSTPLELG